MASNQRLTESIQRPLPPPLQPGGLPLTPEQQAEEDKFNFMEQSEVQMYQHLQDLQAANEKSIERHLQVKTQANKLKQTLTESLIAPENVTGNKAKPAQAND